MPGFRRVAAPAFLLSLALALALPLAALGGPGDLDIDRLLAESRAARAQEAALKQRNAQGQLLALFERTVNQDQYDVQHYDLSLMLNPSTQILSGTNVVTAAVTGAAIGTLDLDLDSGMTVTACTAGGTATTWSHGAGLLTVTLDHSYNPGEIVTVTVSYTGNPGGGAFGWDTHLSQPMIWTLSEPFGAREWWPCKDLNTDKAETMDIRVTVPSNLIVASNGSLESNVDNGNGTRTFHWHSSYPIVPYLVSLAIHSYAVNSDWYTPMAGGDPMEVRFYVYPDDVGNAAENNAKVVGMIEAFAPLYGEYPFVSEKYGHAQFPWGGGMEHQTCTSMGGWWESVIAHELSHQWWGDMVTCADFGHIWLNEGFASWSEAVYYESLGGPEAYRQYMDGMAYFGPGTVFVENPLSDNIFDGNLSYDKGAWLVHMLRGVLGDEDFFAGLAAYRALYEGGSATTEQLRDVLEGVSGRDLDTFMEQWVYGEYFPVYRMSWLANPGGVQVQIEQVQTNTGLFAMPIQLRVTTDQGSTDFVVENALASESYQLAVAGTVERVELDPDRWILRQVQTTVSNPSFAAGILVVNGVDWDTYTPEIQDAYLAGAFWGDNEFDFWDTFPAPAGGYPATLPAPLGHGGVPADLIGQYSAVVWVGNNYNGDLPKWQETPILSYLEVGGNVLLLTRMGEDFLDGALADYLGINLNASGTPGNCTAVYPGLVNVPFTGSQSYTDVFATAVGPNSTLLCQTTSGFSGIRGTGVHAQPPGGGSHRPEGGQFVYLAGRPYRMNFTALGANVAFILEHFFGEPWTVTGAPGESPAAAFGLAGNFPNPFNPKTTIAFDLPAAGPARLAIYDVAGRLVRVLAEGRLATGRQQLDWDGCDAAGREAAAGLYLARLEAAGKADTQRLVLLK
jgi:aminopeptidase N